MRIGVTGSTGFIGKYLVAAAVAAGHEVVAYSRAPERAEVAGAAERRRFQVEGKGLDLGGLDAVIHLAGESVLGRWTKGKRRRILESRVAGTRAVVAAMGEARERGESGPDVLVSASAVGIYGSRGDEILSEDSGKGAGFLADVVEAWEAEVFRAESHGFRAAALRIGLVLGPGGTASRMLRAVFSSGLGGRLGSGRQWTPWIHVEDVARLFLWAVEESKVSGAINAAAPHPVTNAVFTEAAARAAGRAAPLPVPKLAVKVALGEASALLFNSARVVPERAEELGFAFRYPEIDGALASAIGSRSQSGKAAL